jgi:hypothetical protein
MGSVKRRVIPYFGRYHFRWTNAQAACRLRCRSGITEKPSAPRRPPRLTKSQRISRPTQTAQKIAFSSARSLPASLKARATSAPSPSRCGRRSQGILGKLTLRAEDSRPEHSGPELRLASFRNSRTELFHAPLAPREASVHVLCSPGIPLGSKSGRQAPQSLLLHRNAL